jgi:hypothetical protein
MPWHFLGMHLLAVSPVVMLVCLAIGVWQLARQVGARDKTFGNALLMLLLLVPLMARLYPGALQYDGMRHVFVVVPVLAVLAGLGFGWVLNLARGLRHGVWWRGVMITGVPLWLLWQNAQAHPYQGSYLNEVVRAILPPRELADHFDFHSWGTPLHHGVGWLNTHAPVGATVYVPHQRHLLRHYRLRPDLLVTAAPPADLVMYPSWRRDLNAVLGGEPRYAVQCYGADLLLIHAWREEGEQR